MSHKRITSKGVVPNGPMSAPPPTRHGNHDQPMTNGHASPTHSLDSTTYTVPPASTSSSAITFLEPPTTIRPRRRLQSSSNLNGSMTGSSAKRNRSWLGRRIARRDEGPSRRSDSSDEEDQEDIWGPRGSNGIDENGHGPILPSHTPPLNGSRPPSRAKRRNVDRNGIGLSHPADRRPINIRDLPSILIRPKNLLNLLRIILFRQPWITLYVLYLLIVGLAPIASRVSRKSYGFLVRPYPEPTDVMAFFQKRVFPRGGLLYRLTSDRYHRDRNRHFMWYFPIDELINARGPEEFEAPVLEMPKRRKRRSLGESRSIGWEDEDEPLSGWESEAFSTEVVKPSRTMAIREGWRRDLAAGIPLDDAAHRSRFFHELYANTSLHHYKDDLDLISPAFLALHTFSTAGSPASRAERDLVRRYQRSRIPREHYHLVDFQFVICSPFGLHSYGHDPDPKAKSNIMGGAPGRAYKNWGPVQQRSVWEELKAEQEEFGDILIVDEMEMFEEGGKGKEGTMKENMDFGKTYGWMREIARRAQDGRGRKAMFVMKTDADAYHILPNLLNFLLDYDPSKPVYFGSSMGTHYSANMYMQGLGYGFSWPLLQALVQANLPTGVICGLEDHITGSWMYSLPASRRVKTLEQSAAHTNSSYVKRDHELHLKTHWSPDAPAGEGKCIKSLPETCVKPLVTRKNDRKMPKWVTQYARRTKHSAYDVVLDPNSAARSGAHPIIAESDHDVDLLTASDLSAVIPHRIIPDSLYSYDPPSPDPYTGLIRADMFERASSWWYWWAPKTERLITAHGIKTRKEFLDAYEKLEGFWLHPHWIGQQAHAVPYWWDPPEWLRKVAEP